MMKNIHNGRAEKYTYKAIMPAYPRTYIESDPRKFDARFSKHIPLTGGSNEHPISVI